MRHRHVVHGCPWKYYCCRCYSLVTPESGLSALLLARPSMPTTSKFFSSICVEMRDRYTTYQAEVPYSEMYMELNLYSQTSGYQQNPRTDGGLLCQESRPRFRISCSTSGGHSQQVERPNKNLPTPVRYGKPEEVKQFILNNLCVPLESINKTSPWMASKYRCWSSKHATLSDVVSKMCTWNFDEYIIFYKSHKTPLFSAIRGDFVDRYYTVLETVSLMKEFVQYQYADVFAATGMDDWDGQKMVWQEIYDIIDRKKPKVNTYEIIGPASCGKSSFVNWINELFVNVGFMENFNSFPIQRAFNVRIINWSEAHAETSALETVKLILGGDPCPANIKYHGTQTIERTPVFITANKRLIPNSQPFNDRMIRYTWKTAPWLKEKTKFPHPLALMDIFYEFDIIENYL